MRPARILGFASVLLCLVWALAPVHADCTIGGHNETNESFVAGGGWATINFTPGSLLGGLPAFHLTISEVAPRGAGGGALSDSSEYFELYNGTSAPAPLDHVYVSDDPTYYQVVNGPYALAQTSDFNLKFPNGTMLPSGQVLVVCVTKQGFAGSGAVVPPGTLFFEMRDSNLNPADDMVNVATGSVFPVTGGMLTNPSGTNGETLVLYCWDQKADLTGDLDYASWGNPSASNPKVNKTGVSLDGPDANPTPTPFNPDTPQGGQTNLGSGTVLVKPNTYQRVGPEIGEPLLGGNGCVPFEVDSFLLTHANVVIQMPAGPVPVALNGPTVVQVGIGHVWDSDADGLDQVASEMTSLVLTGMSPMGPVTLRLRPVTSEPFQYTMGEIEEQVNNTPGVLDLPPFTPVGTAESYFDVYFEVEIGGMVLHNIVPKHMSAVISYKPPARGELYFDPVSVMLYDETGTPTGIYVTGTTHVPDPEIEVDEFPVSVATVTLQLPSGTTEELKLTGPTTVQVQIGNVGDYDYDGVESVPTEMTMMQLTGTSPSLGPLTLRLRPPTSAPFHHTLGEIEEQTATQVDRLDLPPFAPTGIADSFFDVFFEIEVPAMGMVLHNVTPKHMSAVITHKPPAQGEMYENDEVIQLYEESGFPTGVYLLRTTHTPNPSGADVPTQVAACFALHEVTPNPVLASAAITFELPVTAAARLALFDLSGRVVRTLAEGTLVAGAHSARWDGTDDQGRRLSPGVYFAQLTCGSQKAVVRVVLLK